MMCRIRSLLPISILHLRRWIQTISSPIVSPRRERTTTTAPFTPRCKAPLLYAKKERQMDEHNQHDHSQDGIDRRNFLKCMAWVGTGLVWTMSGGILSSCGV